MGKLADEQCQTDAVLLHRPSIVVLLPQTIPSIDAAPASPTPPPERRPLGRAALMLEAAGQPIVFASRVQNGVFVGHRAQPEAWTPALLPVEAAQGIHNRLASALWGQQGSTILAALPPVPLSNPKGFVFLCLDKVASQRCLEAEGQEMPELVEDASDFTSALKDWGSAYLKPRRGWGGNGIRRVNTSQALASSMQKLVKPAPNDWILQQAVDPASDKPSVALRVLVQKDQKDQWMVAPVVARVAARGAVANHGLGAQAEASERWLSKTEEKKLAHRAIAAARTLEAACGQSHVAEVGLDYVLNASGRPELIEANSVPRGRLLALARTLGDPYWQAHVKACARPLEALARWTA